jgi:hypothetical protein
MARRIVRRGRHLRHLPVAEKAFQSGEINAAHIDAVVAVRRPETEEELARDEVFSSSKPSDCRSNTS